MADRETIHAEVVKIKQLRANYDRFTDAPFLHDAIEAYLKWHEESSVVFSHYFD